MIKPTEPIVGSPMANAYEVFGLYAIVLKNNKYKY